MYLLMSVHFIETIRYGVEYKPSKEARECGPK